MADMSSQSMVRWLTLLLGLAAIAVGTIIALYPSAAGLSALSEDLVVIVGVLAAVQAIRVLYRWGVGTRHFGTVKPGRIEAVEAEPIPGTNFDRLAADTAQATAPQTMRGRRTRLRRRLRSAAEAALIRRRGLDRQEAVAALEKGEWTADPAARAYFLETETDNSATESDLTIRTMWENESEQVARRARRTAEEIAGIVEAVNGQQSGDQDRMNDGSNNPSSTPSGGITDPLGVGQLGNRTRQTVSPSDGGKEDQLGMSNDSKGGPS